MKFIQKDKFSMQREHEFLLVPFFKDTVLETRLKQIIPADFRLDEVIDKQKAPGLDTVIVPFQKGSISVTLMNLGSREDFCLNELKERFQFFGRQAEQDYQILLDGLQFDKHSLRQVVETMIKAMYKGAYSFHKVSLAKAAKSRIFAVRDELKEEKASKTFTIIHSEDLGDSIKKAENYGRCINYARMLGDIPNNYLHVRQLAEYAADLAAEYHLGYEVLGKKELEELHSGGILGVNAGSSEEANLITVSYEGTKGAPFTAIIGKGVMFDSGGYHLKSIDGMKSMKYDMCGAANILAALEIAVSQNSKQNILAVIPAVENVVSPSACKNGDVLTTMSGKTVEVYDPDAEGRLILCDAITYALKKGSRRIIDIATLTYSCQIALGDEFSGIFSNQDEFYKTFMEKAQEQCEKLWRLPLDAVYHKMLHNTQTADLINYAPGRNAGASVAACFLEEFVDKEIPWIHLDIVGPAVMERESRMQCAGATGILTASIAAMLE